MMRGKLNVTPSHVRVRHRHVLTLHYFIAIVRRHLEYLQTGAAMTDVVTGLIHIPFSCHAMLCICATYAVAWCPSVWYLSRSCIASK